MADHTGYVMMHKYTLPNHKPLYTFTGCGDYPRWFMTRIHRRAGLHVPLHYVTGTEATGPQLHQQLTRTDLRYLQFNNTTIFVGCRFDRHTDVLLPLPCD